MAGIGTPSAVLVGDFGQKKRMTRRASSQKEARRFFYPKSRGFIFGNGVTPQGILLRLSKKTP
jgi:hypothetical protein